MCARYSNETLNKKFKKIGQRHFYIESDKSASWFAAMNICRQLGGDLAIPLNDEERLAIVAKLTGSDYWLGINNLAKDDEYVSLVTGKPAPLLKWDDGQPEKKHDQGPEYCVLLKKKLMHDYPCTNEKHYICQA
ncbi:hypothetical protein KR032_009609 [Drosophila birchii]|nr:hypothetical protein KR032_009609 [Drosophila birchii]